jgi:hypothetical protein
MVGLQEYCTYHDMVGDNLVAKNLRKKLVNEDVRKIGNITNLNEIWENMDTLHKAGKVLGEGIEAGGQIPKIQGDSATVIDFYCLLRATILGAKAVGHPKMLINSRPSPAPWENASG